MTIRLSHPKHGFHNVYSEADVERHATHGWVRHVEPVKAEPVKPVEDETEFLKAAYFHKFGKNPHHMMKLENIKKALNDNGE